MINHGMRLDEIGLQLETIPTGLATKNKSNSTNIKTASSFIAWNLHYPYFGRYQIAKHIVLDMVVVQKCRFTFWKINQLDPTAASPSKARDGPSKGHTSSEKTQNRLITSKPDILN